MNYNQIHLILQNQADPIRAQKSLRFFKTGKGQYAEGDQFIGISMPDLRVLAKQFETLAHSEIQQLIRSVLHEERLLALLILTRQYKKNKQAVYQLYVDNLMYVNNWDLVDVSAHLIMGQHLLNQDRTILLKLACSEVMWNRRVAMVATWQFIRNNQFDWTVKIVEILLNDKHELIHKAAGWMLREAGKRDVQVLLSFLDKHATYMPRTMLRYAIEKLPEGARKGYLKKISY
jgi:3-methyladenine DNA glycosylase AlkD